MQKFYITTAIDYVNSFPHCGHALEKIQADVIARYRRLLGEDVFFLTGTDENSLKNVQVAREKEIPVKKLVNRNARKFYELKKSLNLSFDDFIRTTEKRHIKGAQKLWKACQKDIYKKKYSGLYCVGCEEFYKQKELESGVCPEHKIKPELLEEENYFFRLSKYQKQLQQIIEKDKVKIIPKTRKNEVLGFINSGLEDICISRSFERGQGWGIPVPGDSTQIFWTWYDALSNYINAVGYSDNLRRFKKWWPADLHIVGKGIIRFHAVYWVAMLLSAKLTLPRTIFVHGYVTSEGQKMSKSLGNVVDPFQLIEKYGTDAVRYFLLREIPSTEDGDFSHRRFIERYNTDLADGLGNLVSRTIALAEKKQVGFDSLAVSNNIREKTKETKKEASRSLEEFKFNESLIGIWKLIHFADGYIEEKRPWEDSKESEQVVQNLLFILFSLSEMLYPFIPGTAEEIEKRIKKKEKGSLFPKI